MSRCSRFYSAVILIAFLLPISAAFADEIVVQPNATIGKDTWVGANEPTSNHGSQSALYFGGYNGSEFRLYIEFDESDLGPANSVEDARIDLYMFSQNGFIYGYNYGVYRVDAAWSETGLTWNNQPACAAEASYVISGDDWQAGYGQWQSIEDLADLVKFWIDNPTENYGVVIKPVAGFYGYPQFWSSDYSTAGSRPKLVVTTASVTAETSTWGGVKQLYR